MTSRSKVRKPGHSAAPQSQARAKKAEKSPQRLRLVEGAGAASTSKQDIPGTIIFDGHQAMKGYALNKMCFSFNSAENRKEFLRDEDAYCRKYNLTPEQAAAVKSRNVLKLLDAGGNIYYLAKFAGIFGLNVQDIGAQQTGMSVEEFKRMLVAQGE